MLTATRTFRVFVSSTFEDPKAERDLFPKLRKLCQENGAGFQASKLPLSRGQRTRYRVTDRPLKDECKMEAILPANPR